MCVVTIGQFYCVLPNRRHTAGLQFPLMDSSPLTLTPPPPFSEVYLSAAPWPLSVVSSPLLCRDSKLPHPPSSLVPPLQTAISHRTPPNWHLQPCCALLCRLVHKACIKAKSHPLSHFLPSPRSSVASPPTVAYDMAVTQNHCHFYFSMMSMLAINHNALKPQNFHGRSKSGSLCHNCCPCDPPNHYSTS